MVHKLTYAQYKRLVEEQGQAILDVLAYAATGNLDVEIEIPEGIEVITDLAIGFSYLMDDIKDLLRQQRQYQQELEQRVAERTAELEQALAELRAVQSRYMREQWEDYTSVDVEEAPDDTLDALWLPALAEAVQAHKPVHITSDGNGVALALPITYADESIGVLALGKDEEIPWDDEEIMAAQDIVEQLGLALETQRLFDQSQQRAAELSVLNEMVGELAQLLDEAPILEAIYRYSSRLMDTTNFYIGTYHKHTDEVAFPVAVEEGKRVPWRTRPFGNGMTEYLLRTGQPLFVEDGLEKWLRSQGVESIGSPSQSWVGVPLRVGGEVAGVIALQSLRPRFFTRAQFDLLNAVANQAAIAIQNARQFQQEQARAQRQQMLREIAAKVRGSADVDTIMRTAVQEIGQALGRQTFVYLGADQSETAHEDA
ncbi:MAG: GAF domain-containing protein [Anaerolineae bacterium]|nr:GAF domain-containing protein [Anaerolineae bacterium]